eukprot:2937053-Alexandrium_andersonii.AAC.1
MSSLVSSSAGQDCKRNGQAPIYDRADSMKKAVGPRPEGAGQDAALAGPRPRCRTGGLLRRKPSHLGEA